MKFENYSVVKCPMGIAIKPYNGDSNLEVTLIIENDTLHVTLHAHDNDWCGPDHIVSEIQHPIKSAHDERKAKEEASRQRIQQFSKGYYDGWNSEDFKCDKCGEPLGADDLDECGDCHDNTQ